MRRSNLSIFLLLILFITSKSQDKPQNLLKFFDLEYKNRRYAVLDLLDTNSVCVLKAVEPKIRSNDVSYPYRQENNFLYLTGINEPDYILFITPRKVQINNKMFSSILFAPTRIIDTSTIYNEEEIIIGKNNFYDIFKNSLTGLKKIFISAPDYKVINDWLNDKIIMTEKNFRKEFKEKFPDIEIKNISLITSKLREIKSENEIKNIETAIKITGDGLIRAMKSCKPGMYEYEIQAEIEYEFKKQGATGTGFLSIIGSGENSLILHYDKNNRKMEAGDLLVMDVGAEYNCYTADITRTIPVSGKFTEAQKKIYSVVLKAQKETIMLIKPGITFSELDKKAREIIAEAGYEKFIKHSVSHSLGLDVHDVWTSDTLRAGMIITVEPGIYIPVNAKDLPPEFCGFGIRIEDDILVTKTGFKNLSEFIPKEIDEIEKLMKGN